MGVRDLELVRATWSHVLRAVARVLRVLPVLTFTAALSAAALGTAGCLEPPPPERPGYSAELREAGDRIPAIEDDVLLKTRVDNNDGIELDLAALRTGFVAGEQVHFWDLGSPAASLEPLWTFRRRTADGADEPIDHPDLVDSAPGDDGYSPLRSRFVVYVTPTYAGERITSLRALEDAIDLGLVEEPAPPTVFVDRPVALSTARLPTPDGGSLEPEPVYYRGKIAHQFRVGGEAERVFPIPMMGPLTMPNVYQLKRRNESVPIDETSMASDLDGDGDQNDTNLVLSVGVDDMRYRALWSQIDVIVPATYAFGDSKQESDLFERAMGGLKANPDAVLEWQAVAMGKRHLLLVGASYE
jgi:hypothetical protein